MKNHAARIKRSNERRRKKLLKDLKATKNAITAEIEAREELERMKQQVIVNEDEIAELRARIEDLY